MFTAALCPIALGIFGDILVTFGYFGIFLRKLHHVHCSLPCCSLAPFTDTVTRHGDTVALWETLNDRHCDGRQVTPMYSSGPLGHEVGIASQKCSKSTEDKFALAQKVLKLFKRCF